MNRSSKETKTNYQKSLQVRKEYLIVLGVALLFLVISIRSSRNIPNRGNSSSPKETSTEVKEALQPKAPKQQIEELIRKHLEGKNNFSWSYEDLIKVEEGSNSKFEVTVKFNANDNLSKGMIKNGIQIKIAEILKSLFTERSDIQKATIIALFPIQDKYGRSGRGPVYKAELGIEEASKVNWDIESTTLALTILPKVYKTTYPYPVLLK